ncbi:MAG: hypothetical protein HY235_01160 [Acidobacteria bacterium]|nr:hypothetical protein [Acidobacteriota bacterium]
MACYISSDDNRFYVAAEATYNTVGSITSANRFPASSLEAAQETIRPRRRDKTGGRTFTGYGSNLRRETSFALKTYLVTWLTQSQAPSYGPLFESAMGGAVRMFAGGTVDSTPSQNGLRLTAVHGMTVGQGVCFGGELRFVTSVLDAQTVELNIPFTLAPTNGSVLGPTASYPLAKSLKSVSLFDYWSPDSAVHRIATGAVADQMRIKLNGDFHEFEFAGPAADLVDSASFLAGQGQLASFPVEPPLAAFSYAPVAGHLGQVWLGALPQRMYTVTDAILRMVNHVEMRNREFGSTIPRCFAVGQREVRLNFSLYEQDDATTKALYQAGRQQSPIQVMFQLGQQAGQLMGIYMKSLVPEAPLFDDGESRVQWQFNGCSAQGTSDDELYVAFG